VAAGIPLHDILQQCVEAGVRENAVGVDQEGLLRPQGCRHPPAPQVGDVAWLLQQQEEKIFLCCEISCNVLKRIKEICKRTFGLARDAFDFENCFGLSLSRPKNVTKLVLLISSYLNHLPVRSSSMEVVFQIFKILKIILVSA
jgi:hypothetical protein